MATIEQYFSLVEERIKELKIELEEVSRENKSLKVGKKDNGRYARSLALEDEILRKKISFLTQHRNLPLIFIIENLSDEQLKQIKKQYMLKEFNLEDVRSFLIKKFNLSATFHQKEFFADATDDMLAKIQLARDYENIIKLLDSQHRAQELEKKKSRITRKVFIPKDLITPREYQIHHSSGISNYFSFHELEELEEKIRLYKEKMDEYIVELYFDYDLNVLEQLKMHNKQEQPELPEELKNHLCHRVIKLNPDMAIQTKNRLEKWVMNKKWIPERIRLRVDKKRRKKEQEFFRLLIESYHDLELFSFFGMKNIDILHSSDEELQSMFDNVEKVESRKREQLNAIKKEIVEAKNEILEQVMFYQDLQKREEAKFEKVIYQSIIYVKESFVEELWAQSDLKSVMINALLYEELNDLFRLLQKPFANEKKNNLTNEWVLQLKMD